MTNERTNDGQRPSGAPSPAEKERITEALRRYVERYPSQNRAARSLQGVSAGTVSQILNGKTELVSQEMWRRVAAQVTDRRPEGWQVVETTGYQQVAFALGDAQRARVATWVTGEAGCGKTTAARLYAAEHAEAYYILCSEDMHKADFVREIAQRLGVGTLGTVRELWEAVLEALVQQEAPLLIFDEADKLSEGCFHYFIALYNRVEDRCGIVFLSTDYIETRIRRGLSCRRAGYKEIWSRIGRKFFALDATSREDVRAICVANGLTERGQIAKVLAEAEGCGYDLRRVRKSVHRELLMMSAEGGR